MQRDREAWLIEQEKKKRDEESREKDQGLVESNWWDELAWLAK